MASATSTKKGKSMAICKACGVEQAGFMSDICGKCISSSPSASTGDEVQSAAAASESSLSEGDYTSMIGKAVMWLSIAAAAICIFALGRIDVPDGIYDTKTVWSTTLVASFVAAGLNGVFFGFLLDKVGSALRHLEKIRGEK